MLRPTRLLSRNESFFSCADAANYVHYSAGRQTLQNVGASSRLQRTLNFDITGKGSQYDDSRLRKFAANRNHRIQTIHPRHLQIHPLLRLQPVERMKFVEKLRSIHRNPEQRGLVTRPEDWRWSSFRHYATGETGVVEIEWQSTARGRKQLGIFPTVRMPSAEEHPRPSGSLDGAPLRVKLKTIVRATRRTDFSIRIETYV
jgi:hypothetical protein